MRVKAQDALVANRMNLRPGGKQPAMHSTKWGGGIEQSMVFLDGDKDWGTDIPILPELVGKPKGMKTVLQERGLWTEGLKKQCGRKKKDKSNSNFEERLFQATMVVRYYQTTEQYEAIVVKRGKIAALFDTRRSR